MSSLAKRLHEERKARLLRMQGRPVAEPKPELKPEPKPAWAPKFAGAIPKYERPEIVVWPVIPEPVRILVRHIIDAVASDFGRDRADMVSKRRTKDIVFPRQIAMYLAKKLTNRSLSEIGREFGDRDHTTVLHAVTKFGILIRSDEELAERIERLSRQIRNLA